MQLRQLWPFALSTAVTLIAPPIATKAADPVIHVQWDNGGTPVPGTHYTVGSGAFPDVTLIVGHSDWRVWSTDTDNEGQKRRYGSPEGGPQHRRRLHR